MKRITYAAVAFAFAFAFALAISIPLMAQAQEAYPTRPVRIIVPSAPGGAADALPRIVGDKLAQKWKQTVIIDNKPGAAGNIGMEEGARSEPDGYTLVLAPAGNMLVNRLLYPKLRFDTDKDFTPVTLLGLAPNVLVVNPSVPVKTLKQLIDYARENPGKLNFGSAGDGSAPHLSGELLNIDADIKTTHIPYKGMAPALNDVLGGTVQMMFVNISAALPQIRAGKLVPLAIASLHRSPQLPDVPTVAEQGFPGFELTSWYGIVVRTGTPTPIIQKLQSDISEVLKSDEVRAKLIGLGLEPVGNAPEEFAALIKAQSRQWSDIIRKAKIQPLQ